MTSSVQVRIRRLPDGHVRADDFELAEIMLPEPLEGQVSVRNEWMSLDPYMRLGLTRQSGFVAQLGPGDVLTGSAVGIVEKSRNPAFPEGGQVLGNLGWRSRFVASPTEAELQLLDASSAPAPWHLGFLGLTGITAWLGIEEVLRPTMGEIVFVSGAAGAVGSVACQLAKLRGATVLGSAGSDEKVAWLTGELGIDAAVNYRRRDMDGFLAEHAAAGVDCYFDNVGGSMLELFLTRTKPGGRIGLCGAMSQYELGDYRSGPGNFFAVIEANLRLEGFNAFRQSPVRQAEIVGLLEALARDGRLLPCQTIVEGIENVPEAFAGMFSAGSCGKLVVRI